jgi:uncharacterized glyoxalase superfamily protein PhnB
MANIVGIGGVFLQLKGNEQELRDWYETHLQLDMTPYGTNFLTGDQFVLVSFTQDESTSMPSINFRVDDLRELIQNLEGECKFIQEIQEYSYGLFAQIEDPFGNLVELWEPNKKEYENMVAQELQDYTKRKSTKE